MSCYFIRTIPFTPFYSHHSIYTMSFAPFRSHHSIRTMSFVPFPCTLPFAPFNSYHFLCTISSVPFQCCDLLQGLIPGKDDKDGGMTSPRHYEHLYIFTIMWSIGAFLELDDRAKLEEFIRNSEDISLDLPDTSTVADSTMFDFYVDEKGEGGVSWDRF